MIFINYGTIKKQTIMNITKINLLLIYVDINFLPGKSYYTPVIYMNDFWNMQRDYQPLNSSVKELELRLVYQPLSLLKWQIYAAQSIRNKWSSSVLGMQ